MVESDFLEASVLPFRISERPLTRFGAGEDRDLDVAFIVDLLNPPIAGRFAILEDVCWSSVGLAHLAICPTHRRGLPAAREVLGGVKLKHRRLSVNWALAGAHLLRLRPLLKAISPSGDGGDTEAASSYAH